MSMLRKILRFLKNPYTFAIIAEACGILVAFLFVVFQARFLGAAIKGQVSKINSLTGITSIVFGMGIHQAYPYFRKNSGKDVLPVFMRLSLLMLAVYAAVSAAAVASLKLSPKYAAAFLITPLMVYDTIVSEITVVELPNRRNAANMLANVSELLLVFALWLWAKPTLALGVLIILFKHVFKSIVFTFRWRKRIFAPGESVWTWFPRLAKFGFFPMLALLMSTMNYRVDVLMLDGKVPDAAIGVYSIGVLLADRMWMVPDAMKGVMVSNIAKGKDAREAAYVIRVCNTICLFIILGILVLGRPFINFIFGAEYSGAYSVTLLLLLGVFPMINYKVIVAYNNIIGKQNVSCGMLAVSVVMNIAANYVLIPIYGIYGAGIASVLSYGVCSVLFVLFFCRTTGIPYRKILVVNGDDCRRFSAVLTGKRGG